jgi:hypothetical protein
MQSTTTYLDRVRPALIDAGERLAALLTAAPDPGLPVPHSDWTVREAAAHVVTVVRRYADGPERRGTWVDDPRALPELVVHGWDVAQALRQPWPIDPGQVALIMDGLMPIVAGWVDPRRARGLNATFEVRLRGQVTYLFSFRDGRLQVDPTDAPRVDAHISGDPAALLLVLYRRQSQWPHILRGRLVAWGRKPWLALTFAGRFHKP